MSTSARRRFDGKVALVAGAGVGMGRRAAVRFAEEGARIVGCTTDDEAARETAELVRAAGGTIECLAPLDLTDEQEVRRLMKHAADTFGGIDVLYVNAHRMAMGLPAQMKVEAFNYTLTHTLTLQWLVAKHALPHMRGRAGASMVLISSAGGLNIGSGFAGNHGGNFAYDIAKAGVIRLGRLLAIELAPLGIRVNSICPGIINSKAGSGRKNHIESLYDYWLDGMLVRRPGTSDDVVNAALFLASDEASFVTGQNLTVDGGWIASMGQGQPDADIAARIEALFGRFFEHDAAQ